MRILQPDCNSSLFWYVPLGPISNPTKFTPDTFGIKIFLFIFVLSFKVYRILGFTADDDPYEAVGFVG